MIDCHILTMNERPEWRDECLASLEGAPVNLHVLRGVPEHLGEGRIAGFGLGTAPLVARFDPDDIYKPGVFEMLEKAMDSIPGAVLTYSNELKLQGGKEVRRRMTRYNPRKHAASPTGVHGVILMRREAVERFLPYLRDVRGYADWILSLLCASVGRVVTVDMVGRVWRIHDNNFHKMPDARALEMAKDIFNSPANYGISQQEWAASSLGRGRK